MCKAGHGADTARAWGPKGVKADEELGEPLRRSLQYVLMLTLGMGWASGDHVGQIRWVGVASAGIELGALGSVLRP